MPAEAWVGVAAVIVTLLVTGSGVIYWISSATTEFKLIGQQQAGEIGKINQSLEKLEVVVTQIAVDREARAALERRIAQLEKWYDELRRGIGVIKSAS